MVLGDALLGNGLGCAAVLLQAAPLVDEAAISASMAKRGRTSE
eukprot:CAMPEP_0176319664 /NCGR_PEP_ID=MMETSP0121_2-20121125/70418_1 /TAXON_ID=160619 /ORGANISM="Kryptoperidinium foliaceum, Strain CCMP 1326" /LENGTH=42 /DNA_ID= /DNA_START= /DNA_END= /DNA_ORIENTATION=